MLRISTTDLLTRPWIGLMAILAVGLVLRLVFFTGIVGSDDLTYCFDAYALFSGTYREYLLLHPTPGHLRTGLLIPVALFFSLFGVSELSSVLYPLLCSLGNIVLIFYLGRMLFDQRVGFLAASLYAVFPLEVVFATQLLPDLPMSFFMGLCILFFLKGERSSAGPGTWANYALAGVFLGAGYLVKVTAVPLLVLFLVVYLVVYALLRLRFRVEYLLVPAGLLLVLLCEMTFFYWQSGDPLLRLHSMLGTASSTPDPDFLAKAGLSVVWYRNLFVYIREMSDPAGLFGLFSWGAILAASYLLYRRVRSAAIPALWAGVMFLYLCFGTLSFSAYIFLPASARYLLPMTIPSLLLLSAALRQLSIPGRRVLVPGVLALLVLLSLGDLYVYSLREGRNLGYNARQVYSYFEDKASATIYLDDRTKGVMEFLSGFEGQWHLVEYVHKETDFDSIGDCYVVVDHRIVWFYKWRYDKELPPAVPEPPPRWQLVKTIENPSRGTGLVVQAKRLWGHLKGQPWEPGPGEAVNNDAAIYYVP